MEQIIDKILEIHRLQREVDERIQTCFNGTSVPRWHIFSLDDFFKVADALNDGHYFCKIRNDAEFKYQYEFKHRGVLVFCIDNRYIPEDLRDGNNKE